MYPIDQLGILLLIGNKDAKKTWPSQMNICGINQNRVLPETQENNVKKHQPRPLSRVNGWSTPLHSFQALSWTTYFTMSIVTFGIFIPFLPTTWKHAANIVMGGVFIFHLIVHLIAITIDPADNNVRLKKDYMKPMPTFDRSKHAHVIQNQYCHLCEVTVSKKAKHCSSCNKCISGFDHHCKWLNNCVGRRNYWFFFCSVASAAVGLLGLMIILLYIFIQYFVNPDELRTDPLYKVGKNLSTFDYMMKIRYQKNPHLPEKKELPLQKKGSLPQEKSNSLTWPKSPPRMETPRFLLPTFSTQSNMCFMVPPPKTLPQ
ncbi:palmitoyltransferase ZDHHC11-like isoform X5 [Arvicanthis niloticus]|uniref:palmitoyltransferase ZDHHC11-like isoform X5 n=1 Tax=Arvicanthis niloticus TaxID=61156 RepID=UPI00402B5F8B